MKTLVLYSSKYGTTKECAEKISTQLNCDIYSLDHVGDVSLKNYTHIVIGSSVYMGKLRKSISNFIENNTEIKSKSLTFFICCNDTTDYVSLIPSKIKYASIFHLGFELKLSQMKFTDRFITKMVSKSSEDVSMINESEIQRLIHSLKEVPNL